MLHVGIMLVVGGAAGAWWRERRLRRLARPQQSLQAPDHLPPEQEKSLPEPVDKVFDDVGELHHYQRVSWYSLAFSASGAWFYPPAALVSVPLLGYNAYHFGKIVYRSRRSEQRSPMTVFEVIAIAGTLATGRPAMASTLMLFSFGTRKLLLQAGNIAHNVDFTRPINPRLAKVWILREGAELETTVAQVRSGDTLVLHPGDTVLLEGRVMEGEGAVRQFSLNKQMKVIPKQEGDRVFPFTQLESGCLHIQAI